MWRGRLRGVQRHVEVWQALLSVRTLVLPMRQDTHTWLKFASLCRKSARPKCGSPNQPAPRSWDSEQSGAFPWKRAWRAQSCAPHRPEVHGTVSSKIMG